MAARSMPLAHGTFHRAAVGVGLIGAIAAALFAVGQGQAALTLLAGLGVASGILIMLGHLRLALETKGLNERAASAFRALPVPLAVTDRKGVVLLRSNAFSNLVGGLGLDQDISRLGEKHKETAASVFRLFAAARKGKPHAETLCSPAIAKGANIVLRVSPFVSPGLDPLFIWQIEETNGETADEARARRLAALRVPAFAIAKDLSIIGANKSFERLVGSPVAKQDATLFLRSRRGGVLTRAKLREMGAAAPGDAIPVRIATAGGSFHIANLYAVTATGPQGGDEQWFIAIPAESLTSIEDVFELLLGRAPIAMACADAKGAVLAANEAFSRMFETALWKQGREDLNLFALFGEQSAFSLGEKLAACLASGAAQRGMAELFAALKAPPEKRVRLIPFPTGNGQAAMIAAFDAEAASPVAEQAVQSQKLQAVGELAGGIAHDFNNLLTAIIGFSDLLLRRFRASDPAFKDLMNIKNNALRAAGLVQQILAYSRRQTLRSQIVKLTDVVEQYVATMGRALGEKIKLKVRHGRDLWFIKADEGQLFQVVMNLAVNARDAMTDGGEITMRTANVSERESLALKERGLERGEYVMFEIRDTGTGIRPEHLDKIFDPFFSTKEVGKGTGLGLSTVYGIVKQTGGTVLVDSEFGVGTSFRVYLPRYIETDDDLKALENRAGAPEKVVDLTGHGTVLLVEDEEAVRSFASRALSTRGYSVIEAASGVEALEIMEREKGQIDLVVSDVVMPEMDGPTLLRHLRERKPDIKVVFMSGYAEEAFRKNLSAEEGFMFLPKPFTLKKLAETVKAAVS